LYSRSRFCARRGAVRRSVFPSSSEKATVKNRRRSRNVLEQARNVRLSPPAVKPTFGVGDDAAAAIVLSIVAAIRSTEALGSSGSSGVVVQRRLCLQLTRSTMWFGRSRVARACGVAPSGYHEPVLKTSRASTRSEAGTPSSGDASRNGDDDTASSRGSTKTG